MSTLQIVILLLALLALGKGILLLFFPDTSRDLMIWWMQSPTGLLRAAGTLAILIGGGLISSAVIKMGDPVIATVTIVGTLFVIGGMLYLWPPAIQALSKPFRTTGNTWIHRLAGILAFLVAIVFLIILHWSRNGN